MPRSPCRIVDSISRVHVSCSGFLLESFPLGRRLKSRSNRGCAGKACYPFAWTAAPSTQIRLCGLFRHSPSSRVVSTSVCQVAVVGDAALALDYNEEKVVNLLSLEACQASYICRTDELYLAFVPGYRPVSSLPQPASSKQWNICRW